jgi:hypothetical protein
MSGPVPGPAGRGCRSAPAVQLPRWIHEMNHSCDLRDRVPVSSNADCAVEAAARPELSMGQYREAIACSALATDVLDGSAIHSLP